MLKYLILKMKPEIAFVSLFHRIIFIEIDLATSDISNKQTTKSSFRNGGKHLLHSNIHSHNKHNIKPKTNFTEQLKMNTKMINKKKMKFTRTFLFISVIKVIRVGLHQSI